MSNVKTSNSRSVHQCNLCGHTDLSHVFTKFEYELVRCNACGLAFIANPPTPEDLAASYQQEANYHNDLVDPNSAAFAIMSGVAGTHMDFVGRYAKAGTLIDVGCSAGLFLNEAQQAGFDVSGIEFSKGSAAFARSHFGFSVTDGDIHAYQGGGECFDVVTMFDVIEHVPDPVRDMQTAWSMLKPGGLFILSTPNIDGLFPRASYLVAKLLDYWPHPEPPHHLYQFSDKTLAAMLAKTGFEVLGQRQINIDLGYSFGTPSILAKRPKLWPYALLFAPFAIVGPWIGMGDWFYMAARKV